MVGIKIFTTKKGGINVTLTAGQTAHFLALLKTLMPIPLFHIMHFFKFFTSKMRCFSSLSDKNDGL